MDVSAWKGIPLSEACEKCDATGEIAVPYHSNHTNGPTVQYVTCPACNGTKRKAPTKEAHRGT